MPDAWDKPCARHQLVQILLNAAAAVGVAAFDCLGGLQVLNLHLGLGCFLGAHVFLYLMLLFGLTER